MTAPEIGVACSRCDDPLVIARDGIRDPDHPRRFMHRVHRAVRLRSLADLVRYDPDGTRVVLVPAGTVGVVRAVIPQEGMPYPDLEIEYPDGTIERSPADSFTDEGIH